MTSTCSVEDVVDAADGWHLFGTGCPNEEIVFMCQVVILYTVIVISIYNLTVGHGASLESFAEQLVGLSVTHPVDEKRRWRLSFISFYPVMHRWLLTRTIRWHSTLPTYHVA